MPTTTTSGKAATSAKKRTTNKAAFDAVTAVTTAAAILKKYGSISEIEKHRAALREKYGPQNWTAIRRECKEIRQKDITTAAENAKRDVFGYVPVLVRSFVELSKNKDYKRLCGFARATYKGTDADTAAALVRDWYTNIDTTTGAPLVRVSYIDTAAALIYTAYQPAKLDGRAALVVLQRALDNIAAAARKSARKATDTTAAAKPDNKRTAGAIVDVFDVTTGAEDTFKTAAALTGPRATTDKTKAAAVKAAARLIGRKIPATAAPLVEINAAARAAYKRAAAAALVEKYAALKADAAAAGVDTAPRTAAK